MTATRLGIILIVTFVFAIFASYVIDVVEVYDIALTTPEEDRAFLSLLDWFTSTIRTLQGRSTS